MDGIPVKISEKYKPPRTITLPASVRNKINSIPTQFETYDFKLERSVIDRIAKLEELKKKQAEKRAKKLEILKKFETARQERIASEAAPSSSTATSTPAELEGNSPLQDSQILTPTPINFQNKTEPNRPETKQDGSINLSDFENDTSSPFDNVELKTINEMEELAHVLGTTSLSSQPQGIKQLTDTGQQLPNGFTNHWAMNNVNSYGYIPPNLYMNNQSIPHAIDSINSSINISPSINSISSINNINPPHIPVHTSHLPACNTTPSNILPGSGRNPQNSTYPNLTNMAQHIPMVAPTVESYIPNLHKDCLLESSSIDINVDSDGEDDRNKFEIFKGLQMDLEERRQAIREQTVNLSVMNPPTKVVTTEPLFRIPVPIFGVTLNEQERLFATNMAEMGFPYPRVAKAVQQFGVNEAKVVEYLLQIQSLIDDKKFPEELIEKALQLNDFDESKTRQYLNTFYQIMNLGFKEDDVAAALAKTTDRDKALDMLIS